MSFKQVSKAFGERAMPGLSQAAKLIAHKGSVESGCRWYWRRRFQAAIATGDALPCETLAELFREPWFKDAASRYSDFGVFAWADQPNMTVHLWHNSYIVDQYRLTAVLGHELGHLAASIKLPKRRHADYDGHPGWRDEWRADLYGEAATLAALWVEKIYLLA